MSQPLSQERQAALARSELASRGAGHREVAAVLIRDFGMNPRAAFRHAAGLSQAQVAENYNQRWPADKPKTYKHVSYWECWAGPGSRGSSASARKPSYEDLGRLAELYDCLVDDLLFGPRQAESISPLPIAGIDGYPEITEQGVTLHLPAGEGTFTVTISRRQFAELLAASGLAAALPAGAAGLSAAGREPVSYYRRILTAHQDGHYLLPPRTHMTELAGYLRQISSREGDAVRLSPAQARRIASEYAEHLSWLSKETGDLPGSRDWASRAAGWALESGDTPMASYMLLRNASIALDNGDHAAAVRLTGAARHTGSGLPPALLGIASAYQARANAQAGLLDQAALDTATSLLSRPAPADLPYLRFYDADFADVQRAACYTDAGDPGKAITILQARLTAQSPHSYRDKAACLSRLGFAHAAAGQPDAAATAGMGALQGATRTGSRHVIADLNRLSTRLTQRWPGQPHAREFADALATASYSA